MTPLTTLKARVDEAEEGSRELDVAIWCAVQPDYKPCGPVGCYTFDNGEIRWRGWKECPALTSSVDAALALIEAKCPYTAFKIEHGFNNAFGEPFGSQAGLWQQHEGEFGWTFRKVGEATCKTPALALCSALLAALIAKEQA